MRKEFGLAANGALLLAAALVLPVYAGGPVDTDGDGVDDATEQIPSAGYDGNLDTVADYLQGHVASFPSAVGPYLTLDGPAGTRFSAISVLPAPLAYPSGTNQFPVGLVDFTITDLDGAGPDGFTDTGAALYIVTVNMTIHSAVPPLTGYWKHGPLGYTAFNYPNFGTAPFESGAIITSPTTIAIRLLDDPSGTSGGALFQFFGDSNPTAFVITDPSGPGSGDTLLVDLSSFTATAVSGGIQLDWTTAAEVSNAGFNIFSGDGVNVAKVNASLIPAAGLDGAGASYSYLVEGATSGTYYLEDVDLTGTKTLHGPVTASGSSSVSNWELF